MEDSRIIDPYWRKDSDAISESARKYGAYCFAVADTILHNNEDSEECINDTWMRDWYAMPPQRLRVLRMFLAKITRNLAFDRSRAQAAEKRGGSELSLVLEELTECLTSGMDVEVMYEGKELRQCIRRFVRTLPERDGNVFVRRYFLTEPVAVIAQRYDLMENHVMVILSRTRKKLKRELKKEGYL